jgi:hypothetical protein
MPGKEYCKKCICPSCHHYRRLPEADACAFCIWFYEDDEYCIGTMGKTCGGEREQGTHCLECAPIAALEKAKCLRCKQVPAALGPYQLCSLCFASLERNHYSMGISMDQQYLDDLKTYHRAVQRYNDEHDLTKRNVRHNNRSKKATWSTTRGRMLSKPHRPQATVCVNMRACIWEVRYTTYEERVMNAAAAMRDADEDADMSYSGLSQSPTTSK